MATAEDSNHGGDGGGGKDGSNLLGPPTFEELENGRFRCVETGHEMPAQARDSYSQCKRCRIGLIDYALSHKNPPLNMFKQDPLCRSKLICKLTGDNINKSEEHIWKHINGRRFLNKLEQMEEGASAENDKSKHKKMDEEGSKVKENGQAKGEKKKKKKKEKMMEEIVSEVRDIPEDSDSEEPDFWMPPVGERWDNDGGGDRWGSVSGEENDENIEAGRGVNEPSPSSSSSRLGSS